MKISVVVRNVRVVNKVIFKNNDLKPLLKFLQSYPDSVQEFPNN